MKYAQILKDKVHWIFESDEKPQFAPNILLVDITDNAGVLEGWDYDAETGAFTEPIPIEPRPEEMSELEYLTDYVTDVDFRLLVVEMGL